MFLVEKKGNKDQYELVDMLYKHTAHKDVTREALQRIFYEASTGNIIASDGRRLVIVNAEYLPSLSAKFAQEAGKLDRCFTAKKSGSSYILEKDEKTEYVNFHRVLPDIEDMTSPIEDLLDFPALKNDTGSAGNFSHEYFKLIYAVGAAINFHYIRDVAGFGPFTLYVNKESPSSKGVLLQSSGVTSLVMPMLND